LDGSKLIKVILDVKDKELMQIRIVVLKQIYKKITTRDIVFEFRDDPAFY
jgi:small subunit ribosomal protein S7e